VLVAATLAGCATRVGYPPDFPGQVRDQGVSYADAVDYLVTAKKNVRARIDNYDRLQRGGKQVAAASVVGLATNAAFQGNRDSIAGFATLGGLAMVADRSTNPAAMKRVYDAGLANLQCIGEAGEKAHLGGAATRIRLAIAQDDLDHAVSALRADTAAARSRPALQPDVSEAERYLQQVASIQVTIAGLANDTAVGGVVVDATEKTIMAINRQVDKVTPSLTDIMQAGATFDTYFQAGLASKKATEDIAKTINTTGNQAEALVGEDSEIGKRLDADKRQLKLALESVGRILDAAPDATAGVTQCQTTFPDLAPLKVTPEGPVSLAPGERVTLVPQGAAPYGLTWDGGAATPADLEVLSVLPPASGFVVTARSGARAGNYKVSFSDAEGRTSSPVAITVTAPAQPVAEPPPADQKPQETDPNRPRSPALPSGQHK